jgi:hypothetical protein
VSEEVAQALVGRKWALQLPHLTTLSPAAAKYLGELPSLFIGVEELSAEKLTPLLKLKYHDSIPDAVADLGAPKQIQEAFIGFQKFLYMFAS